MKTTKKLKLLWAKEVATTYAFAIEGDFGWAYATVNDTTGELIITSDWGSWSYIWSPKQDHLGSASLTHFIGERDCAAYIKDKLLKRYGQVFSAEATTKHLQKMVIEQRRGDTVRALTKHQAREIWDELESLARDIDGHDEASATLYLERAGQIDGIDDVCQDLWDEVQHVESQDSKVLMGLILPALVAACADRVGTEPRYVALKAAFDARRAAQAAAQAAQAAQVRP